jgi:endoglucanase
LIFRGVTLAGAEFGEMNLPGTYLTDYIYPDQSEVDYFKSKNMSTVRLPFRWERLQRTLGGAFDTTELSRLDTFVNAATASGVYVVLDPHNYARYNGNIIGSGTVTNAHFADFWSRLANRYKSNNRIIFALMNEPHTMPTEQWLSAANAGIAAIRAAGATNLILVPGNAWTGGHSWNQNWYGTANAVVMQNIVDSGNNYAIEIHQYLDADSSGVSANCVSASIGVERLTEVTAWLNTHGKRAFLGEFAGGNNPTCQAAVQNMLQYMQNNNNVWIGWTWWAAGPWWADYFYSLEPANGVDKPQMNWLAPYLF